ncbi:50S ribosomal protein L21 [Candidatus Borkfalkia ceftriaxoniphila]|uniref:Large ribosomal subunit protein bL21 n=1 Tax=Candidatus Borkfalkia ceftriaxoniphila TaxID=2508949 RepID=A0A4Q2K9X1_9FIRM|nr:50S ribosomal protein L21 [Candidatus Borkfalkia ceftriaxoniphila]RXZ61355.1 50S ribosomal protein L21 [Candidatus Borkfalkia ceftriaxoniphila]
MYAIIENGNKQYRVSEGEVVRLEKLNANVGDSVEFNVVMVSDENGVKYGADVANAKVSGTVQAQDKFKKIIVFKYKAKKNERKKQGHRQPFTAVKIEKISL